jgi:hypothetical protein
MDTKVDRVESIDKRFSCTLKCLYLLMASFKIFSPLYTLIIVHTCSFKRLLQPYHQ